MARHNRNTPEWFNREKLDLIEHLKAVDSFSAAARSFQKLADLGGGRGCGGESRPAYRRGDQLRASIQRQEKTRKKRYQEPREL
jgi:hypothetical protein